MSSPLFVERYALVVAERRKRTCPVLIMTDEEKKIVARSYHPDFDFTGFSQEKYKQTIDKFIKANERLESYYEYAVVGEEDSDDEGYLDEDITWFQEERCVLCRVWGQYYCCGTKCESCGRLVCGTCQDDLDMRMGYAEGNYCSDCYENEWAAKCRADMRNAPKPEYKEERDILARCRALYQAEKA